MAKICVGEDINHELTCKRVPERTFENSTYIVDTHAINEEDITSDAISYDSHSCPVTKVCHIHNLYELYLCFNSVLPKVQ